jgi:hypothetical protein
MGCGKKNNIFFKITIPQTLHSTYKIQQTTAPTNSKKMPYISTPVVNNRAAGRLDLFKVGNVQTNQVVVCAFVFMQNCERFYHQSAIT